MIYFYNVRLSYFKNNTRVLIDYVVSFAELIDFLYEKRKINSSLEIYWIKPYYPIDKRNKF